MTSRLLLGSILKTTEPTSCCSLSSESRCSYLRSVESSQLVCDAPGYQIMGETVEAGPNLPFVPLLLTTVEGAGHYEVLRVNFAHVLDKEDLMASAVKAGHVMHNQPGDNARNLASALNPRPVSGAASGVGSSGRSHSVHAQMETEV